MSNAAPLEKANSIVSQLLESYPENHDIVLAALESLDGTVKSQIERITESSNRKKMTEEKIQEAVMHFTSSPDYRYYYVTITSTFVACDTNGYSIVNEDSVLSMVLPYLQRDEELCRSKHKLKHAVIRGIKSNLLTSCIPNSDIIQRVVGLFTTLFSPTKSDAKHLITRIGDILLKKNSLTIVVTADVLKNFIAIADLLKPIAGHRISYDLSTAFRSTYTEDMAENCRVVRTRQPVPDAYAILKPHLLDILAVCYHYSNRYTSGDEYVGTAIKDQVVRDACLAPSNQSIDNVIEAFSQACMIPHSDWRTPKQHIEVVFRLWAQRNHVYLHVPLQRLVAHGEYTCKDNLVNCTLLQGDYAEDVAYFCRKNLVPDSLETLLELSDLYEFFLQTSDSPSHDETLFKQIVCVVASELGGDCDGTVVNKMSFTLWDRQKEVNTFLATADIGCGEKVWDAYRVYAATPGKKVSRAYFSVHAERSLR